MSSYKEFRSSWIPKKLTGLSRPGSIVDIGAGNQIYRPHTNGLTYTAIDNGSYSECEAVFLGWDKKDHLIFDINYSVRHHNTLKENQFDYGLCTEVFEHLLNPVFSLEEMCEYVGKELIITAPTRCTPHMEPHIYYSGFFPNWYRHWLPVFNYEILDLQDVNGEGVCVHARKIKSI